MKTKEIDCTYAERHDFAPLYLTGQLSASDAEAFEAHYLGCARCWGDVRQGEEIRAALGQPALAPDFGPNHAAHRRGCRDSFCGRSGLSDDRHRRFSALAAPRGHDLRVDLSGQRRLRNHCGSASPARRWASSLFPGQRMRAPGSTPLKYSRRTGQVFGSATRQRRQRRCASPEPSRRAGQVYPFSQESKRRTRWVGSRPGADSNRFRSHRHRGSAREREMRGPLFRAMCAFLYAAPVLAMGATSAQRSVPKGPSSKGSAKISRRTVRVSRSVTFCSTGIDPPIRQQRQRALTEESSPLSTSRRFGWSRFPARLAVN